jgi:TRAP-type C4-dicarboxylate transport system substrate-binding protein
LALLATLALIVGVLAGGAQARQGQARATTNWDFLIPTAVNPRAASMANFEQAFVNSVFKKTGGRLKITLRSPGELPFSLTQTMQAVSNNQVQMGDGSAFLAADNKVTYLALLPGLINTQKQFFVVSKLLDKELNKELANFNVTRLLTYMWPAQILWGTGEPPKSVTDMKGKKVRTNGEQQAYLFDKLGATPVSLTSPEVPPALQRRVVDAATTAAFNAWPGGWANLISWGYLQPINITPSYIIVNRTALNSLPRDVRTILLSEAAAWEKKMQVQIPKVETLYRRALENAGITLVPANSNDSRTIRNIMRPYWQKWADENGMADAMKTVRHALGK